jgi:hypothetical protein
MPVIPARSDDMPLWARCNYDGRPIHPDDQWFIDTFAIWLRMDEQERMDAVRLDPEWRKFALGETITSAVEEVFRGNENTSSM